METRDSLVHGFVNQENYYFFLYEYDRAFKRTRVQSQLFPNGVCPLWIGGGRMEKSTLSRLILQLL